MLTLLLTVTLAAAPATLLVWGGGKTPEDAEKAMADYQAKVGSKKWVTLVKLADGFPKILQSDKVQGMNPGFHVVVLGACSASDTQSALDMFKVAEPAVYAKPVTWDEPL